MSTNYYFEKVLCEHCKSTESLHIGKSSCALQFVIHGYEDEKLLSWKDWEEYIKKNNGYIKDEFGTIISLEELTLITEWRKKDKSELVAFYDFS